MLKLICLMAVVIALPLTAIAEEQEKTFRTCSNMMNGHSCAQFSKDSHVFEMCCEHLSDNTKELGKLEVQNAKARKATLACLREYGSFKAQATPCETRGCYCGIDDSALAASCFGKEESCCGNRKVNMANTDLNAARNEYQHLKGALDICKRDLKKIKAALKSNPTENSDSSPRKSGTNPGNGGQTALPN